LRQFITWRDCMKKCVTGLFSLAFAVFLLDWPAMAHHSFAAEYDATKVVTMTGYVTKIEWTNPHVWFYVNIKNPDGTTTNWGFEMGPPHGLQNRGWTRTTMKLGDERSEERRVGKEWRSWNAACA